MGEGGGFEAEAEVVAAGTTGSSHLRESESPLKMDARWNRGSTGRRPALPYEKSLLFVLLYEATGL